jgi:hypothetical protein
MLQAPRKAFGERRSWALAQRCPAIPMDINPTEAIRKSLAWCAIPRISAYGVFCPLPLMLILIKGTSIHPHFDKLNANGFSLHQQVTFAMILSKHERNPYLEVPLTMFLCR